MFGGQSGFGFGQSTSQSNVFGQSSSQSGFGNLFGQSSSQNVFGFGQSTSQSNLFGQSSSQSSFGFFGQSSSQGGFFGQSSSQGGFGLFGQSSSQGGFGLFGQSSSQGTLGIFGGQPQKTNDQLPAYCANVDEKVKTMLSKIRNPSTKSAQTLQSIFDRMMALHKFKACDPTVADRLVAFGLASEPFSDCNNPIDIQSRLDLAIDEKHDPALKSKYEAAKRANPSPSQLYVTEISGFAALELKIAQANAALQQCELATSNLKTTCAEIRQQFSSHTLRKLETVRKKHTEIQAMILECVGLLEAHLNQQGNFARDNALASHLERDYKELEAEVFNGPISMAVIQHLHAEVDECLAQRGSVKPAPRFPAQTVHKLTTLLDDKKMAYEKLRSDLKADLAEVHALRELARRS